MVGQVFRASNLTGGAHRKRAPHSSAHSVTIVATCGSARAGKAPGGVLLLVAIEAGEGEEGEVADRLLRGELHDLRQLIGVPVGERHLGYRA